MTDDTANARHHFNRLLENLQSNPQAAHHHELAHEHYTRAADDEKLGNEHRAEFHRSRAERHADEAEDYEKQPRRA